MGIENGPKRRKGDVIGVDISLDALHTRVSALEQGYQDLRYQLTDAANEMRANTELTEEIHGEVAAVRAATAGIVEFVKRADANWTKWKDRAASFRRGSAATGKWLAAVTGGAVGLVTLGRMMGWW